MPITPSRTRPWLLAAAAALAAAALVALLAPSEPSARSSTTTVTYESRDLRRTEVDLSAPGLGVGDVTVLSADLHRGGRKVGEVHSECTIVRLNAVGAPPTGQCTGTASLPRGDITMVGLSPAQLAHDEPFVQAITGGTRRYDRVRGTVEVDEAGTESARFTFSLRP